MNDKVIIVDSDDQPKGLISKTEAHHRGLLHRAISVFLVNDKNEVLLQQRADEKYHSGGKWANTCCSHPIAGESTLQAANRRLMEEMGLSANLEPAFITTYNLDVGNGMIEHELDHVFFGITNVEPTPHPGEVQSWKYMSWQEIANDLKNNPSLYASWFHELFPLAQKHFPTFIKKREQTLNE